MPKRQPVKMWTSSRKIPVISHSRYENNDPSVKTYWKNYVRELELSYKDDKFWDSNAGLVREIVPPSTYKKLSKIFDLPLRDTSYVLPVEMASPIHSAEFFASRMSEERPRESRIILSSTSQATDGRSMSSIEEEQSVSDESSSTPWSETSAVSYEPIEETAFEGIPSAKSIKSIRSTARSSRSFRRSRQISMKTIVCTEYEDDPDDDLCVQVGDKMPGKSTTRLHRMSLQAANPHYFLLHTGKSETDMISWESRYKKKKEFAVSASDEFSKKAEATSRKIARDFFAWFSSLGEVEFKSELKRPEDIEQLFQVWFDEHASRGIVIDPKILPCVLQTVANAVGLPQASCYRVLKRQVACDIKAEGTPKHTVAFNACLPHKMKHIPPENNTAKLWRGVKTPEDLSSMACVWDGITHLTSTKEFEKWLSKRVHLPMPAYLAKMCKASMKKLFVVPSDFVVKSSESEVDGMALPQSQFDLELKTVLSHLLE